MKATLLTSPHCALAKKEGHVIMVDDAHAWVSLVGHWTAAHFGLTYDVELIMSTS
jgi:7-keto-8-aminopelargonate synthetase-like enzyme